ncbi:MAG: hypothetical protein ACREBG_20920 [Pyrinomonadaceae bacterium]
MSTSFTRGMNGARLSYSLLLATKTTNLSEQDARFLLVSEILVNGEEHFKLTFYQFKEFPVFLCRPSHLIGGLYLVLGEQV